MSLARDSRALTVKYSHATLSVKYNAELYVVSMKIMSSAAAAARKRLSFYAICEKKGQMNAIIL